MTENNTFTTRHTITAEEIAECAPLLAKLDKIACEHYDGHFTLYAFTTNWRVGFGTPCCRENIEAAPCGATLKEAVENACKAHECEMECIANQAPRCTFDENGYPIPRYYGYFINLDVMSR